MATHRSDWLALTSHHKWVFFQFRPGVQEPYITYSSVIPQENDTRPFRALLGMMLASEFGLLIDSRVNERVQLESIGEERRAKDEPPPDHDLDKQDKSGTFKARSESSSQDPPTGRTDIQKQSSPEFHSQKVTKGDSPIMLVSS